MSRPLRKGGMIPVRLSLEADAELRRRCDVAGTTPALWIAERIERAVLKDKPPPPERLVDVTPTPPEDRHDHGHDHGQITKLATGLWRAGDGCVSGDRGLSWRRVSG